MSNPFLSLDAAVIDVLDDMVDEWRDKDRHGELADELNYGPKKTAALNELSTLITEAWKKTVNYRDVEKEDA